MRSRNALFSLSLFVVAFLPASAQDESRRYKTGQIKVGDHILASAVSGVEGDTCVVTGIRPASWRPGYDGDFLIQCDHSGLTTVAATADHVQPGGAAAPATPPHPAAVPYYQQPARGAAPAPAQPTPQAAPTTPRQAAPAPPGANAFGSRKTRPCPSITHQPNNAEAALLAACFKENQSRNYTEWLVDSPVVTSIQVGKIGAQTGMTNLDPSSPLLSIRGSYVLWQCRQQDPPTVMAKYSNMGHNCMRTTERRAAGYCYRTRAGNWTCSMDDDVTPYTQKDSVDGLPPPR